MPRPQTEVAESITKKFGALANGSENMTGIINTARDLTTAIESRFGLTPHSIKAIHDVLDAVNECQLIDKQLVDEEVERMSAARAVRQKLSLSPGEESNPQVVEGDKS